MAALCWSSCEEIPHAQGKRNPSKMVGVVRGFVQDSAKFFSSGIETSSAQREINQ